MATAARAKAPRPKVKDRPQIRVFRALLRAHAHVVELHRRHFAAAHGIAIIEFDMIAALGNTPGLRMGELAGAMITSPGNVTRVAQALERRGLVERARAAHSDREVIARLTPAGEAFFRDHFVEVADYTTALMDRALAPREQAQLAALLEKLQRPR